MLSELYVTVAEAFTARSRMGFSLRSYFRKSYVLRSLYWLLVLTWIDLAVKFSVLPKTRIGKKRIVFVKMDGIGDYVIWTAAFPALRDIYPSSEYELILIGNERFKGLAESEPVFDRKLFVNLDRLALSPSYRFRLLKEVRMLNADVIFNARSARDLIWGDSIVRSSAAREKISSEGTGNLMLPILDNWTRSWYTEIRPAPVKGEHEFISNLKFLGVKQSSIQFRHPVRPPDASVVDFPDYAVLVLGSQAAEKCWPVERFARVAEEIDRKYKLKIVLCGGMDDRHLAEEFRSSTKLKTTNLLGKTSLVELASVLSRARVVISNDTGAAHIAAAADTPTVVISPGSEVGRYFPYPPGTADEVKAIQYPQVCSGCAESCRMIGYSNSPTRPCIRRVTIDDVCRAVEELLKRPVSP